MSTVRTSVFPRVGRDSSCECTETDTKLKLQILLHNWPAVIGHTNNKDKTTDLKQAVESRNTLSAIALKTKRLKMTGNLPAELLMKMRLCVPGVCLSGYARVCMTATGFIKI